MFIKINKFAFVRNSTNALVRSHIKKKKKLQSNRIEEIMEVCMEN